MPKRRTRPSAARAFALLATLAAGAAACASDPSVAPAPLARDAAVADSAPDSAAVRDGSAPVEDAGDETPLDTCLAACEQQTPGGVAKLTPIFTCANDLCPEACTDEGGPPPDAGSLSDASSDAMSDATDDAAADATPDAAPVCSKIGQGPGKFTWFDVACDACLVTRCCDVVTTCVTDALCDKLNQCEDQCYRDHGNL